MGKTNDNSPRNHEPGVIGALPKYTPEEFAERFEAYCEHCEENKEKPTASGMAYFMGFASRQSLWDYRKKPGYEHVSSRAMLFVEKGYEQQMAQGRGDGGIVFALKNFGWTDKQEIEHSEKVTDSGGHEW